MIHSRLVAAVLGLAFIGMTVVHAQHGAAKLTTQDYIDIQQRMRVNIAIDTGDGEGWAGTFTPDGVFNTNKGHDALGSSSRTGATSATAPTAVI